MNEIAHIIWVRIEHAYECRQQRIDAVRKAADNGATREQLFVVARCGWPPESPEETAKFIKEVLGV